MKKGCILKILCVFCVLTLLSVDFSLVAFAEDGTEIVEVAGEQCATYPGPEVFSDVMLDVLTDETAKNIYILILYILNSYNFIKQKNV